MKFSKIGFLNHFLNQKMGNLGCLKKSRMKEDL